MLTKIKNILLFPLHYTLGYALEQAGQVLEEGNSLLLDLLDEGVETDGTQQPSSPPGEGESSRDRP